MYNNRTGLTLSQLLVSNGTLELEQRVWFLGDGLVGPRDVVVLIDDSLRSYRYVLTTDVRLSSPTKNP